MRRPWPETYAGTVYTIGRTLLMRTAAKLKGEYEFYPLPEELQAERQPA